MLPKHWWEGQDAQGKKRDISATTLEIPLGSGPYRDQGDSSPAVPSCSSGCKDHWGKDLPVNIGQNNFDELRFDYFRDDLPVAIEAFKADADRLDAGEQRQGMGDLL